MSERHRIRSSLGPRLGETAMTDDELRAMAAAAWRKHGVVVFTKQVLERMPDIARALVEGEARRAYGPRESRL